MNSNTIKSFSANYPSGHAFQLPAAFTSTTSSETQFLFANGQPAVMSVPLGTEILGSQTAFSPNANQSEVFGSGRSQGAWMGESRPYFNASSFNDRAFRIRASGLISGGGTTVTSIAGTVSLYAALTQASTVTSGTRVATIASGAILGNVRANWYVEQTFIWDSTSQTLQALGNYTAQIGSAFTATTAAAITTLALSSLSFGLTWTFATTSTSNTVGMVELSLEQV